METILSLVLPEMINWFSCTLDTMLLYSSDLNEKGLQNRMISYRSAVSMSTSFGLKTYEKDF